LAANGKNGILKICPDENVISMDRSLVAKILKRIPKFGV
jgi:hypothetical protein